MDKSTAGDFRLCGTLRSRYDSLQPSNTYNLLVLVRPDSRSGAFTVHSNEPFIKGANVVYTLSYVPGASKKTIDTLLRCDTVLGLCLAGEAKSLYVDSQDLLHRVINFPEP